MGPEVGVTSLLAGGHQARNAGACHVGPGRATCSPGSSSRSRPARPDRGPGAGAVLRARVALSLFV